MDKEEKQTEGKRCAMPRPHRARQALRRSSRADGARTPESCATLETRLSQAPDDPSPRDWLRSDADHGASAAVARSVGPADHRGRWTSRPPRTVETANTLHAMRSWQLRYSLVSVISLSTGCQYFISVCCPRDSSRLRCDVATTLWALVATRCRARLRASGVGQRTPNTVTLNTCPGLNSWLRGHQVDT